MQISPRRSVVLLVEDDPADQELVRRLFQSEAGEVNLQIVGSGSDALDYFARSSSGANDAPRPALVLLDLDLTDMTGYEVLGQLRQMPDYATLPVVILSTSNHPNDIRKSYELGCNSYLQKQQSLALYRETVRDLSRYWLQRNLLPPE